MSTYTFMLLFVIPLLSVILIYYFYYWYKAIKMQKRIIDSLVTSNSLILDNKNSRNKENIKDRTWLRKKMNFAGFESVNAPYTFIIISILTGLLSAGFIFVLINSIFAFIFAFVLFSLLPLLVLIKIISAREEEFNIFLKEIIDKVTSMMKSGVGYEQGLKKSIMTTHSKFTKKVFDIYLKEKDIIGENKAFEKMFALVDSKELRIFYLTVSIGKSSGGKFSNTLEKLRKTLHDQGEIKQEIVSSTREIKIGSYMIIAIVIFIYILMNSSLNNALNEHFFGSQNGKLQLFFIIIWVALGLFINNLLTKIK
ncbi:MAG: hypothetical protein COB17_04615 [Sulfurimonas sp.]|nr:MAG: hypothetical protein COB17_04615 [Sulfurimonas sp.]